MQATSIITVISKDGTILYQSPSISKILGYESTNRIGANFITSKLVHPEDVAKKQAALESVLACPNIDYKTQLRLQHKDGSWRWAETVFNNQLSNPDILGIVIITHDITEMKRLERQKDDFVGFASHELKTPLTSIKGLTQILQKRFSLAHDQENLVLLQRMAMQEERLIRLISDFLDVNKIQTGALSLRKSFFAIDDLITKIIDSFQYIDKNHTIIKKGVAEKKVFADEDRIEQVLSNLLTNAIKYSPGTPTIILSVSQDKSGTLVSVQDFGSGIYKKDIDRIFDRFYRTGEKANSPISGFGLGLYITREIIKGHGGEIWVESTKGKGSTFSFRLPSVTL
jgi:PAS domain S-box-containing protein